MLRVIIYCDNLTSMNNETLNRELEKTLIEALDFQQKSEIELATSKFLRNEVEKLGSQMESPHLTPKDRENLTKQMYSLKKKIEHEKMLFEQNESKAKSIEQNLDRLLKLVAESK